MQNVNQRQLEVEVQQDHDRPDQRQPRLEERHDRIGHEAFQRLHVVGHARDQHPCGAALVETDRQHLQVGEDADAQIRERALSDPADEVGLDVGHQPHQQRRAAETRARPARALSCRGFRFRGRSRAWPASGGASDGGRAEQQRDEHPRGAQAVGPNSSSSPRRLRPRLPRLARSPVHCCPPRPIPGPSPRPPPRPPPPIPPPMPPGGLIAPRPATTR